MSALNLSQRPRRNRVANSIRTLACETRLHPSQLVQPLFVHEAAQSVTLESLPGQQRLSLPDLSKQARQIEQAGIAAVVLFPKIPEAQKDERGSAADDPTGLVPQAIQCIKEAAPNLAVITDVALDPYSNAGHDGIVEVASTGEIQVLNDATIERLCAQALSHAQAGADIVAPSDMMDGRVGEIRKTLESAGYQNTGILAYSAKYASAFYGPFRGALDSAPKAGDKKSYQMNPANWREALREASLDEAEGADMLMVKPAGAYLDVIAKLREQSHLPLAAYQVSGEYLMIEAAAASGWLEREAAIEESLLSIARAGADFILSYYALEYAEQIYGSSEK